MSILQAVVDASVIVKLFVPENQSAQAHALFARFASEQDAELIVPDLCFVECANVFWKWVQRSAYPAKEAQSHLQDIQNLGLTTIPTEVLADKAFEIAVRHAITAYDACYVATASELGVSLITADQKLVTALAQKPYDIQWLGKIVIPE